VKKTREIYESTLQKLREKSPDDEAILRSAMDAFDEIQSKKKATNQLLEPIVQAASFSRLSVSGIPVDLLRQLTEEHEEARVAVSQLARGRRSHDRFNAIMCIGKDSPKSFQLKLLSQGLRDRSSSVRWKSADWAGRLRLRELVPELEEAFAREKHEKARQTIELELRLLRDGFILDRKQDGTMWITTFVPHGIRCQRIEQTEIDARGIEAIAAEIESGSRK